MIEGTQTEMNVSVHTQGSQYHESPFAQEDKRMHEALRQATTPEERIKATLALFGGNKMHAIGLDADFWMPKISEAYLIALDKNETPYMRCIAQKLICETIDFSFWYETSLSAEQAETLAMMIVERADNTPEKEWAKQAKEVLGRQIGRAGFGGVVGKQVKAIRISQLNAA